MAQDREASIAATSGNVRAVIRRNDTSGGDDLEDALVARFLAMKREHDRVVFDTDISKGFANGV